VGWDARCSRAARSTSAWWRLIQTHRYGLNSEIPKLSSTANTWNGTSTWIRRASARFAFRRDRPAPPARRRITPPPRWGMSRQGLANLRWPAVRAPPACLPTQARSGASHLGASPNAEHCRHSGAQARQCARLAYGASRLAKSRPLAPTPEAPRPLSLAHPTVQSPFGLHSCAAILHM
jgi:hypothetical protein